MPKCRCTTRNFPGQWGRGRSGVELRHFDKCFVQKTRERDSAGKHFGFFFLPDTLKTIS